MGIFSAIKYLIILVMLAAGAYGFWYISNLQAQLSVSELNNEQLEKALVEQQSVIENTKKEIEQIQTINKSLQEQADKQRQDVKNLTDKFSKDGRDFGAFAESQPEKVQTLVNRGTLNVLRCMELASGAPLNQKELSAKTPLEANRECPSLIDPDFKPATP